MQYQKNTSSTTALSLLIAPLLKRLYGISIFFMVLAFSFTTHASNKLTTDHPLMSRFQGAESFHHHFYDYIGVDLPTAEVNDAKSNNGILHALGRASFITYRLPKSTSQLAFVKVMKHQIAQSAFTIVFECQQSKTMNTCGEQMHEFTKSKSVRNGFQFSCGYEKETFVLTAKITRVDNKNTYLYLCSENGEVNQTIIEEKDIDYNQVTMKVADYQPDEQALSGLKPQTKQDIDGAKDHALISRYPGSIIDLYGVSDFMNIALPIKFLKYNEKMDASHNLAVSGKVTFVNYKQQTGLSQFQVVKNYQRTLKQNNVDIFFQCKGDDECGDKLLSRVDHGDLFNSNNPNLIAKCGSSDAAIITAKKQITPTRNTYFLYCFNDSPWLTVGQYIIEEKNLQTDLVTMSADVMINEISANGKVAIYGVLFASNSDEIQAESADMLKQIAMLLTKQPTLSLYVVGHTDSQGDEQYNKALAGTRAQSVIDALHKDYGIARKRLQARGVGELVPVSSNSVKEGRQLNRRVELVEI